MIRLTADDLRRLADQIENREKYGSMCGVVYAIFSTTPTGGSTCNLSSLASMRNVIVTITAMTG